ncbi:hypothetical protein [Baekduia sp. Peel2402]|uniref:hypothetical protein n=1 Tax=Baekduia sp. Peel2402 TaxID=3458296 RepID=UPI00403ECD91
MLQVVGAAVLIALVVRPMVLGRTFIGWDWYPHQWYVWHQAHSIRANLMPSLFAHDTIAVFNPHYAFYGGTLYALAGCVTLVVGDPGAAMVIVLALAFAGGYGGWWWLARQAGLGGWVAHVPAALFVTAPYQLAIIYSTGGFAEFVAVSMIPLLAAGVLAVLRADRLRFWPSTLLTIAVVLVTGSHNITLLWATTFLAAVAALSILLIPDARQLVTRAGVLRLAVVVLPAALVNAWFLLPDVAYQSHTVIASWQGFARGQLEVTMTFVRPEHLFTLGRGSAWPSVPHHALGLPLLAAVWILGGLLAVRRRYRSPWYRLAVLLSLITVSVYLVMTRFSLLWGLPKPYNNIQFAYRLETYIVLAVLGALVATLVLVQPLAGRRRRVAVSVLGVVAMVSVAGAAVQLRQRPPSQQPEWKAAGSYLTKNGVPSAGDYVSKDLNMVSYAGKPPVVRFPASAEDGDRATVTVKALPGQVVLSNIVTMPQLVHLQGARFIGRESTGHAVLKLAPDVVPNAASVTISAAHPWPVTLGRVLSGLGLLGVAFNLARLVRRR